MIRQRIFVTVVTVLIYMVLPAFAQAENEPRLRLVMPQSNLIINQQTTIEVVVEQATAVYGTEVRLFFDPAKLEVVELKHGDFLSDDPDNKAFVLHNVADNELGTIDYALSLLNPAPPATGDGLLLQITVLAKEEGPLTVGFEYGLFGTQTGEEITPATEGLALTILNAAGELPQSETQIPTASSASGDLGNELSTDNGVSRTSIVLGAALVMVLGFVAIAGLIGLSFWMSHTKGKKRPEPVQ